MSYKAAYLTLCLLPPTKKSFCSTLFSDSFLLNFVSGLEGKEKQGGVKAWTREGYK